MKSGYCSGCAGNTDHELCSDSAVAGLVGGIVRTFASGAEYGPWYCTVCRRVSKTIEARPESHAPRRVNATSSSAAAETNRPQATVTVPCAVASAAPSQSARFSQKYRNAVARKILAGRSTFNQSAFELSIDKKEIWNWLVDLFEIEQQQISDLKKQVRALKEQMGGEDVTTESNEPAAAPEEEPGPTEWSNVVVDARPDRFTYPTEKSSASDQ